MSLIDQYIQKITELLQQCHDVELLEIILQILQKSR